MMARVLAFAYCIIELACFGLYQCSNELALRCVILYFVYCTPVFDKIRGAIHIL
jgi:hypothetical protein